VELMDLVLVVPRPRKPVVHLHPDILDALGRRRSCRDGSPCTERSGWKPYRRRQLDMAIRARITIDRVVGGAVPVEGADDGARRHRVGLMDDGSDGSDDVQARVGAIGRENRLVGRVPNRDRERRRSVAYGGQGRPARVGSSQAFPLVLRLPSLLKPLFVSLR